MSDQISIQLDPHLQSHIFAPGDKVTGKVNFSPRDETNVDSITINFEGMLHTWLTQTTYATTTVYPHKQPLFSTSSVLLQGPFKLRAATHEYPFSFTFPAHCNLGDDAAKLQVSKLFGSAREQELLPTMPNSGGQVGFEVTYKLIAKIPRALKGWKDEVDLKFTPVRKISKPDPMFKEIREDRSEHEEKYRLDDSGEPRAITVKDGVKNMLHFRRNETTKKSIKVRCILVRVLFVSVGAQGVGAVSRAVMTAGNKSSARKEHPPPDKQVIHRPIHARKVNQFRWQEPLVLLDHSLYSARDLQRLLHHLKKTHTGPGHCSAAVLCVRSVLGTLHSRILRFGLWFCIRKVWDLVGVEVWQSEGLFCC